MGLCIFLGSCVYGCPGTRVDRRMQGPPTEGLNQRWRLSPSFPRHGGGHGLRGPVSAPPFVVVIDAGAMGLGT